MIKIKQRLWCGLPWTFTTYTLDTDREVLNIDNGILVRKQDEIRLYRISDVGYSQSIIQKIFGVAHITVHTSDRSAGCFIMKNVKDAKNIKNILSDAVEASRKDRVMTREILTDNEDC